MQFRPLPILTLVCVVSLAILIMLGNWQYERYATKLNSDPANLPDAVELTFTPVAVDGASVQMVYGIADSEPIWRGYIPATRSDTGEPVLLCIGASGGPNPVPMSLAGVSPMRETVRIFPRIGRASARNQPENDTWFVFDRAGILAAFDLTDTDVDVAEPVTLAVRNASNLDQVRMTENPYGAPELLDPLPPQRHFGYAVTWWGLAAALFVIYFVFHASQGRLQFRAKP